MMTSGGGGYCDCGDPEAWKAFEIEWKALNMYSKF